MNRHDITAQLSEIFASVFGSTISLRDDMTAGDVDDWDSLMNIRLMISVEQRFNVRFTSAEITKLRNVGEMISLITAKIENK